MSEENYSSFDLNGPEWKEAAKEVTNNIAEELRKKLDIVEAVPTEAGLQAASKTLEDIKKRSFSGRHPELGKMIKCQICGLRHRENERKCKQVFAKRGKEELIAGKTPETETVFDSRKVRQIVGAASFKGKRKNRHWNKRQLQFIELVHKFTPDEYDETDLDRARKEATRILVKKWGGHGFLPPVWEKRVRPNSDKSENIFEG